MRSEYTPAVDGTAARCSWEMFGETETWTGLGIIAEAKRDNFHLNCTDSRKGTLHRIAKILNGGRA